MSKRIYLRNSNAEEYKDYIGRIVLIKDYLPAGLSYGVIAISKLCNVGSTLYIEIIKSNSNEFTEGQIRYVMYNTYLYEIADDKCLNVLYGDINE